MTDPTQEITTVARQGASKAAGFLDQIFGGKLQPAHITVLSLLGHIPVAWALVEGKLILAAVLLVIFGLMDALDGALARHQGSSSLGGMYFDAVSDRIKEVAVYTALTAYLIQVGNERGAWLAAGLCGAVVIVSYVKAKGEMALAQHYKDPQALNKVFQEGIARYEVRTALLVAALLTSYTTEILTVLLALVSLTIATRFLAISEALAKTDKVRLHDKS